MTIDDQFIYTRTYPLDDYLTQYIILSSLEPLFTGTCRHVLKESGATLIRCLRIGKEMTRYDLSVIHEASYSVALNSLSICLDSHSLGLTSAWLALLFLVTSFAPSLVKSCAKLVEM